MADEPVVIMLSGNVLQLDDVASRLGVSRAKLVKACQAAGREPGTAMGAFYTEWLGGKLPIPVMPCRSRSLYELYKWWCRKRSMRPETETMLLSSLPAGLSKKRRHIMIGDHMRSRMMIEPDEWRPEDGRSLGEQFGEYQAEFERLMLVLS